MSHLKETKRNHKTEIALIEIFLEMTPIFLSYLMVKTVNSSDVNRHVTFNGLCTCNSATASGHALVK